MEFEENDPVEEQDADCVEIYSKTAIFWFSIFFSPIAGGILLMLNLRAIGNKKAGNIVLLCSIAYLILAEVIQDIFIKVLKLSVYAVNGIAFFLTIAGAATLSEYVFKKYFPDDDYYPKSVGQAIFVALAITVPLSFLVFYYSQTKTAPNGKLY